ncbi:hypothetical protein HMPREF0731_3268, partial [Pseudoroseomonas cervicalis ATCC 49957]
RRLPAGRGARAGPAGGPRAARQSRRLQGRPAPLTGTLRHLSLD